MGGNNYTAPNDNMYSSTNYPDTPVGPFLATVIGHQDGKYLGRLNVLIQRQGSGNNNSSTQTRIVDYMSPFWGVTGYGQTTDDSGNPGNYDGTQKSYGMWMVPPDPGSTVLVIFLANNPAKGYWIGCVPKDDSYMNFMTPGIAATKFAITDDATLSVTTDSQGKDLRVPVTEYNKRSSDNAGPQDPTRFNKPIHPLALFLDNQGLLLDDIRGITTSSARREVPSTVFGISTPGPIDRDGQTGLVGTKEANVPNAPVSRLGGQTFIMDDGHNKYLRKTDASSGPPEYASVENGETDGDPLRPHNELIRLRTRTGAQILFHTSEDLIYITNSRGTSWIEMTSDGKIDVYAQDSISMHTDADFNFLAGRDINLEAVRNINIKAGGDHQLEVVGNKTIIVTGNRTISVKGTHDETIIGATNLSIQGDYNQLLNGALGITVANDININTAGGTAITTAKDLNINTTGGNNLTAGGKSNFNSGGQQLFTAGGSTEISSSGTNINGGNINLNSGSAASADKATEATKTSKATLPVALAVYPNPTETDGTTLNSIMLRVPTTEPYPHHENLNPTLFKTSKTDIAAANSAAQSQVNSGS